MVTIYPFVFNPFSENTYVIFDQSNECIIIDPGNHNSSEDQLLSKYISQNHLNPVRVVCTHCHIDHVYGLDYIYREYGLLPEYHELEIPLIQALPSIAQMYDTTVAQPPACQHFIAAGDTIQFGLTEFQVLLTPGHSPGSISLYCPEEKFCMSGDVLFNGSIGRTDLPGGSYKILIQSIENHLMTLPDDTIIYSGHGEATSIGFERKYNPFLQ